MRIAVDAMGSDAPPNVEVEGAVQACLNSDIEVVLVGDETLLREKLSAYPKVGNVQIRHAPEVVSPHEPPVLAVRKKKQSSLLVAMRMVKEGEAQAIISAGNTGAVMVAARIMLGTIPGVSRPAVSQTLPNLKGKAVVLDLGANVDCSARQLCQFAEMGVAYSRYALGVENPRVALLNIGEENLKGGAIAREAHAVLSQAKHLNFVGNVEPRAMTEGRADVVVCDGFIGNLFLKTTEAVAYFMGKMIRETFESTSMSKIGAVLARKALLQMKHTVDPNEYPGAPLLGINGTVIILHGSCTAKGVENAILGTRLAVENNLIDHIRENIRVLRNIESTPDEGTSSSATIGEPMVVATEQKTLD